MGFTPAKARFKRHKDIDSTILVGTRPDPTFFKHFESVDEILIKCVTRHLNKLKPLRCNLGWPFLSYLLLYKVVQRLEY